MPERAASRAGAGGCAGRGQDGEWPEGRPSLSTGPDLVGGAEECGGTGSRRHRVVPLAGHRTGSYRARPVRTSTRS
ncbi:hypothetical protein JCM4914_21330 [Streptomyces platensis subsp. malvinus]